MSFLLPDSLTSRSDHLPRTLKSHLSGSLLGSALPDSAAACPHSASDEECCHACPLLSLSQETLQDDSEVVPSPKTSC